MPQNEYTHQFYEHQKLVLEADSENFSTVLENIKVQAKKIEPQVLIKG